MHTYPKPDFPFFFKTTTCSVLFLVVLHWLPEIATWTYATFYEQKLAIEPSRFRTVLLVGYAIVGVSVFIHLAGLLWAAWHQRKQGR